MYKAIFTLGHSTHPIEKFIKLLRMHGVSAVCDVRSSPYSRFNPQYNRENLKASLKESDIKYVFLGKELGARSEDPCCYQDGRVSYDRLAKTDIFRMGIDRLLRGAIDYDIALVCAEKDPLECHRTILVARELEKKGCSVLHILENGKIERHEDAIARLIREYNSGQGSDFFLTAEEIQNKAYSKQAEKISYALPEEDAGDTDVTIGVNK